MFTWGCITQRSYFSFEIVPSVFEEITSVTTYPANAHCDIEYVLCVCMCAQVHSDMCVCVCACVSSLTSSLKSLSSSCGSVRLKTCCCGGAVATDRSLVLPIMSLACPDRPM